MPKRDRAHAHPLDEAASTAIGAWSIVQGVKGVLTHAAPAHPVPAHAAPPRSAAGAPAGRGSDSESRSSSSSEASRRDLVDADLDEEVTPETVAAARARSRQHGVGRHADRPSEIPARGWKAIGRRVARETKADNVPLLSAGVAFYALLSLFPATVALVGIYGLVADPSEVSTQLASVRRALPKDAADLILNQVRSVAGASNGSLGITVAIGILTALWSASSGMKWMMSALSLVYDEREERKFVKLRGTALLLTVGATVGFAANMVLLSGVGAIARSLGLGNVGEWVVAIIRWPLLVALLMVGLSVLYRYGPDRDEPRWRWVSWGAAAATLVWLLASVGLAVYASLAGKFEQSYGSLAGVVVLMLWLFLSAFAVLIGAEINAEMEHQTAKDTTEGRPEALGQRGATVADTVAA